jgi:pimeloyl-ACP methyl ester carboxylesterase
MVSVRSAFSTRHGLVDTLHSQFGQNRPAVVFLHGNSACKEVFQPQLDLCAELGLSFLALDFPGHGLSERPSSPQAAYSIPGYAAVVSDVMAAVGFQSVVVVGWSLGGHVALELLGCEPKIIGVMIVGTPPVAMRADCVAQAFLASERMNLAFKPHFTRDEARAYADAMMGISVSDSFVDVVERTDGNARLWLAQNGVAGIGVDQRHIVETSDVPLAVVHGAHEPFVRLEYLEDISYRNLWHGKVHMLNAGHAPHVEQPQAFNAVLRAFLHEMRNRVELGEGAEA